ncbi:hypothetical protein [Actinomadura sp. GTD37]|uniref:hypothetical protein n=1 Tax=Actinomadura sp. GTD37 TaxID=1778030 RepID=UPI0035BEEE9C
MRKISQRDVHAGDPASEEDGVLDPTPTGPEHAPEEPERPEEPVSPPDDDDGWMDA